MDSASTHPPLHANLLNPIVRRVLGSDTAAVDSWQTRVLSGGFEASSSLYGVTGTALNQNESLTWTAVLKIVRPSADRTEPSHWNYWRREACAYESGLLLGLPPSLAAPRCFSVVEQLDGSIWIWLEALVDAVEKPWPAAQFSEAAHRLGAFNGAYLAEQRLPEGQWVSHGWLRSYVTECGASLSELPRVQSDRLVAHLIPPVLAGRLSTLWHEREFLLGVLDQLPQTFCHLDAWSPNLFITGTPSGQTQLVAVDWAFAGIGALGQELAPFIAATGVGDTDLASKEARAVASYIAGLRDAGWQGDEQQVWLGYRVAVALTYGVAAMGWLLSMVLDERQHAWLENAMGTPIETKLEEFAAWAEFVVQRVEHARPLLGSVAR